jgi:hypothetical protein
VISLVCAYMENHWNISVLFKRCWMNHQTNQ